MNDRLQQSDENIKRAIMNIFRASSGTLKKNPTILSKDQLKCNNSIIREWVLNNRDVDILLLNNFLNKFDVMTTLSPQYFSGVDYVEFAFVQYLFEAAPPEMSFLLNNELDRYREEHSFKNDFEYAGHVLLPTKHQIYYMVGRTFVLFCVSSQLFCCFPRSDCDNWNNICRTILFEIKSKDCLSHFSKRSCISTHRRSFFAHVQFVEFETETENKTSVEYMKTIARLCCMTDAIYKNDGINLTDKQKLCYELEDVLDAFFNLCRL